MTKPYTSLLAIAAVTFAMISATASARAAPIPLSQTNLAPGVYVVTKEGFWTIPDWVAAHPGKAVPASIIVVPDQQQQQVIVKENTNTKIIHDDNDNHSHKHKFRHFPIDHGPVFPKDGGGSNNKLDKHSGGSSSSGSGGSSP